MTKIWSIERRKLPLVSMKKELENQQKCSLFFSLVPKTGNGCIVHSCIGHWILLRYHRFSSSIGAAFNYNPCGQELNLWILSCEGNTVCCTVLDHLNVLLHICNYFMPKNYHYTVFLLSYRKHLVFSSCKVGLEVWQVMCKRQRIALETFFSFVRASLKYQNLIDIPAN